MLGCIVFAAYCCVYLTEMEAMDQIPIGNMTNGYLELYFMEVWSVVIYKVVKETALADRLLTYVQNCSWVEAKEHIAEMLRSWTFSDWETMFVAIIGGKIVGMESAMKTDYYPLPDIFPWVSCIFVSEEYRGRKISGELISYANGVPERNWIQPELHSYRICWAVRALWLCISEGYSQLWRWDRPIIRERLLRKLELLYTNNTHKQK